MRRRLPLALTLLVLCSLFCQGLPPTLVHAQGGKGVPPHTTPISAPPAENPPVLPDTLQPDLLLPALSLTVSADHDPVRVGEVITVSLRIANLAPHPAADLVVSLPLPDGAVAEFTQGFDLTSKSWIWPVGSMAGQAQTVLTTTLRLAQMPKGEALLLQPVATARDLNDPIQGVGGSLVDERVTGPVQNLGSPDVATETATDQVTSPTATADSTAQAQPGPTAKPLTAFRPGRATMMRSPRGRVQVRFPGDAAKQPLQLAYRFSDEAAVDSQVGKLRIPPALANGRRGFGVFHLDATDAQGRAVHTFDRPITIVAHYTPEQLRVLGMNPGMLTLFWFDPDLTNTRPDGSVVTGQWVPLASTVNASAQTVTATVNHFSAFQLGNGLSPSSAFIPSLKGWQTSGFTGAATYSYAMDVPAGPGDLKPNVTLSYNSTTNDGPAGSSNKQQASWVGRDWSSGGRRLYLAQ